MSDQDVQAVLEKLKEIGFIPQQALPDIMTAHGQGLDTGRQFFRQQSLDDFLRGCALCCGENHAKHFLHPA